MYNGAEIMNTSKKHSTVDVSTTAAELTELFHCALDLKAIRKALSEIGMEVYEPTLCYEDNQPCIRVAEGGNFSSGGANSSAVRAMDIRCSKVQEMILDDQELRVQWLESCKMVADLNSKQLPRRQFEFLRDIMNGYALVYERHRHYLKDKPTC